MADEIKYEYETVRTVRGTDGLVISKLQKNGWEIVGQAQGTLRPALGFRRPKKPQPWLLIGAVAAVLVILTVVAGVASVLSEPNEIQGAGVDACEARVFVRALDPVDADASDRLDLLRTLHLLGIVGEDDLEALLCGLAVQGGVLSVLPAVELQNS